MPTHEEHETGGTLSPQPDDQRLDPAQDPTRPQPGTDQPTTVGDSYPTGTPVTNDDLADDLGVTPRRVKEAHSDD